MTDTTSAAPSDAEIDDLWRESVAKHETTAAFVRDFARAVLARWGAPPAVAPWRSAVLDLIDECPGLTMEQDRWLSRRVKELDFASTPQPTQAQAVAVPLTDEKIKDEASYHGFIGSADQLVKFVRAIEAAHGVGIKKENSHGLPT